MSAATLIARDEWRLMRRNRVAMLGLATILLLSVIAGVTAIAQRDASGAIRARFQAQADKAFDGAPARHPHRMVHYGHFVFRPLPPLAAFDPGVDAFTGNTIYLEGHRQNSANFGDIRQSSLLVRFGQLTPAFVLQALAPLVLIFIGFGVVARERERATIRQLYAHSASARAVFTGKALALGSVAAIMLLPAALALSWLVVAKGAATSASLAVLAGFAAYLAVWVLIVVIASSLATTARAALLGLIAVWALTVVLLPRLAPHIALGTHPLKTRLETDIAIAADLRRIGDSHDPDDPFFARFKARILKQYSVARVEDLPFNYRGALAVEGEKLTSGLFDDYAARQFAEQRAQSSLVDAFGAISPTIAVRRVSMAASGTDLDGYRRFLAQAEAYRFAVVQRLNRLQATAITYADDGNRNDDPAVNRRVRINPGNWQAMPDFEYRAATEREKLAASAPAALMLFAWLAALLLAARFAIVRLARAA